MSESSVTAGKKIRIVIDTNVWISFFISKALKKLKKYLGNEDIYIIKAFSVRSVAIFIS
ncbi:MAG: hypothetical protein MUF15_17915 [Acidobacteria bacterium]|jgi:predicted nucleic acid-binding protein|nr:hypothetical protein [Acidobacteriota bacterium]